MRTCPADWWWFQCERHSLVTWGGAYGVKNVEITFYIRDQSDVFSYGYSYRIDSNKNACKLNNFRRHALS